MKKQELHTIAADLFEKNPDAENAYITEDGHGFLQQNRAYLHANTNASKKKLRVHKVARIDVETQEPTVDVSKMKKPELLELAKDLGLDFKTSNTVAELKKLISDHQSNEDDNNEMETVAIEELQKMAFQRGISTEDDEARDSIIKKIKDYDANLPKRD
ncbi:hypothetical protein EZY14_009305 [Kordia sp. TARA_039_SRF]|nr:hypothetical protein EZY14_009305 [Kordia sp. TARA_039_SRF]